MRYLGPCWDEMGTRLFSKRSMSVTIQSDSLIVLWGDQQMGTAWTLPCMDGDAGGFGGCKQK